MSPDFETVTQGPGVVSLQELQHRVPGKAVREYDRASKAFSKNQFEQVAGHLKRAIEIDPEFVAARNNLATLYLQLNRPEEAATILESTLHIDPHNYVPCANLALAYLMLNRYDDAEHAARRAVDVDRVSTKSKFVLGLVLATQKKFTPEAVSLLKRAGMDHPQANLLAAEILAATGELAEARTRVNEYLASGDRGARNLAQQWLVIIANAEREARANSAAGSHP